MSRMPRYSLTSVNVGETTWSSMPEAARDALHERGLAGAELAREHDGVAGAQGRRQGLPHLAGVLGRRGPKLQPHQNSSSCSSAGSVSGTTMRSLSPGADAVASRAAA